jgi:hypothetical protein
MANFDGFALCDGEAPTDNVTGRGGTGQHVQRSSGSGGCGRS